MLDNSSFVTLQDTIDIEKIDSLSNEKKEEIVKKGLLRGTRKKFLIEEPFQAGIILIGRAKKWTLNNIVIRNGNMRDNSHFATYNLLAETESEIPAFPYTNLIEFLQTIRKYGFLYIHFSKEIIIIVDPDDMNEY